MQRTDTDGQVGVALRKTGDDIVAATVSAVEPVKHGRTMGRRSTTDAGVVTVSASQTFMVAPPAARKPTTKKAAKTPPASNGVPAARGTARPPAPGKPARINHADCDHPRTFAGREACRRERRAAATSS